MRHPRRQTGFTLIEILVVVVILAILAAIVLPQFTSAAEESRTNSLQMSLHRIRQQIEIYQSHHSGQYPDAEHFVAQMTQATDILGNAGTDHGPYIRQIPNNPFTGTNDIGDGEVGSSAWYYDETTGEFRANDTAAHRTY